MKRMRIFFHLLNYETVQEILATYNKYLQISVISNVMKNKL